MHFTKTVNELTHWLTGHTLLKVINKNKEYCIECEEKSWFLGRLWSKSLSFFGSGSTSLSRVVSIVREVLSEYSKNEIELEPNLKQVVKRLNKKIKHYERRRFLWTFPLPRSSISPLVYKPSLQSPKQVLPMTSVSLETNTVKELNTSQSKSVIVRRGICNEGNTCFAASTIQALIGCSSITCGTEDHDKTFQKFMDLVKTNAREPAKGIATLLEHIYKEPWDCQPNDPENFLNTQFPDMKGIFQQRFDSLPLNASIQEIANGQYQRNKKPIVLDSTQKLFIINIIGRVKDNEYSTRPINVASSISLLTDQGTREKYRMVSSIIHIYACHHYYTLEPVYNPQGKISEWIEYNDSTVIRRPDSPAIQKLLNSTGYMFFYKKAV